MKFQSYEAQVSGAQVSAGLTVEGSFVGAQLSELICRELNCRVTRNIRLGRLSMIKYLHIFNKLEKNNLYSTFECNPLVWLGISHAPQIVRL